MLADIGIIDYGVGNLKSVMSACQAIGANAELVSDPAFLDRYPRLLLPGVGSYSEAWEQLIARGVRDPLNAIVSQAQTPILGICVGMQLLADFGAEGGDTPGLGYVSGEVRRFDTTQLKQTGLKIPHVGFNQVDFIQNSPLFDGFSDSADFYFTHSYRMMCTNPSTLLASCSHGENFAAVVNSGPVFGTQFHPEKSQANGLKLMKNFLSVAL